MDAQILENQKVMMEILILLLRERKNDFPSHILNNYFSELETGLRKTNLTLNILGMYDA